MYTILGQEDSPYVAPPVNVAVVPHTLVFYALKTYQPVYVDSISAAPGMLRSIEVNRAVRTCPSVHGFLVPHQQQGEEICSRVKSV